MSGELLLPLCGLMLAVALAAAVISDLKWRIIPNSLNLAIAAAAPIAWWAQGLSLWPDVGLQVAAAAGLFLFFLIQFNFNLIGGGDVKLLGAVGLWVAPALMLNFVLYFVLVGGVVSLIMLINLKLRGQPAFSGSLNFRLPDEDDENAPVIGNDRFNPYGLAIAVAGGWVIHQQYINHFLQNSLN
jgi:prepilin peptidase CpaA